MLSAEESCKPAARNRLSKVLNVTDKCEQVKTGTNAMPLLRYVHLSGPVGLFDVFGSGALGKRKPGKPRGFGAV